ncbi:hypothetical protein RUND412_002619 [Rhizina undulata]
MADYGSSTVWNETVFYAYFGHDPRADTYQMPPARRALLLTFYYAVIFISLAVVGARLYTRLHVSNAFGMDDWAIIPAEVSLGADKTFPAWIQKKGVYKGGLGKPADLRTYAELINYWKLHYVFIMQSAIVIFLIRTHIILFLRRILPMQRPRIFTLLHVVNALHCTSSSLPWALICVPREMKIWNLLLFFQNHCYDQAYYRNIKASSALLGVTSAILDFVLLGIPVVKVWRSLRNECSKALIISFPLLLAGIGEFCLGILAASIPALHTLYRRRCSCTEGRSWRRHRKSQAQSIKNSVPWNAALGDINHMSLIGASATPQGTSREEFGLELASVSIDYR